MEEVRETCGWVVENARWVRIKDEALAALARRLGGPATALAWDPAHHFSGDPETTAAYILAVDAVNFCFWAPAGVARWEREIEGQKLSGYVALAAALTRGVMSGAFPVADAGYLARITARELARVLGGQGTLLLLEERAASLRDLGRHCRDAHHGRFLDLTASARGSAPALARILAKNLPSFDDSALYQGRKVYFLKRAQLAAADLAGAFHGQGPGAFSDLSRLTCFADYKLPQVLRHVGALEYAPELAARVDSLLHLAPGSEPEVEIRAATVEAVERLARLMARDAPGPAPDARTLDNLLWTLGQDDEFRARPYHRAAGVYY